MSETTTSRRDFLGLALAGTAGVGAIGALSGVKKTWDPLPSVISAGFTTVDLSQTQAGKLYSTTWRGKPIFVIKKKEGMPSDEKREVVIEGDRYTIMIGLCTHLGCIPAFKESKGLFKCACHGGEFDTNGNQTFGPPPRPLDIPPFSVNGNKVVLGEEGPEYKKLIATA